MTNLTAPRTSFLCLALLVAVVGCKGRTGEASVTANVPADSKVADLGTFSLAIPNSWHVYNPSDPASIKTFEADAKKLPKGENMLSSAKMLTANKAFRLLAFDSKSSQATFANNLNVLVLPVPEGTTLKQVTDKSKQMVQLLGTVEEDKDVTYGGIPFHQMRIKSGASMGNQALIIRSYYTVLGTENVTFTFTSTTNTGPKFGESADQIMASFKKR